MSKVVRGGSKSVTHTLEISACVCVCTHTHTNTYWDLNPSDSGAYWRGCKKTRCWFCVFFLSLGKKKVQSREKGVDVLLLTNVSKLTIMLISVCVGIHYRGNITGLIISTFCINHDGWLPQMAECQQYINRLLQWATCSCAAFFPIPTGPQISCISFCYWVFITCFSTARRAIVCTAYWTLPWQLRPHINKSSSEWHSNSIS